MAKVQQFSEITPSFAFTEGALRTQADKWSNQEDGNPDHLFRHPYCQCGTQVIMPYGSIHNK